MASHHVVNGRWQKTEVPINPDAISFGIEQAPVIGECDGCMFSGQLSPVCNRAGEIAKAAGGFDCEDRLPNGHGIIYVRLVADQRQKDLINGQAATDPAAI